MNRAMKLVNLILGGLLLLLVMYGIETSHATERTDPIATATSKSISGASAIAGAKAGATAGSSIGDIIGGDLTGGDLNLGGNKSYVLAPPGLGDVAIARCLGSEAWTLLIGGKQKLVLNQVCMAEFYLKVGRYDLAAQSLCNQPEILEEYSTEVACEIDHDFTPVIVEGEDQFDHDIHSRSDEFAEAYAQQEYEIEFLQEENASIVGRLDDLTALLEQASAPAPTPIYIPQEPEPKYSDEDMSYILGLYADEETEND